MRNYGVTKDPDDPEMPTGAEWQAAGQQMGKITGVGVLYTTGSRLRHWWASWKGTKRQQLREWLGIEGLDADCGEMFSEWYRTSHGLRADLDATNAARASQDNDILSRVALTEANLAEMVRQFHQMAQRLETHAATINGITKVPIVNKSVRTHLNELEIKRARAAAREARGEAEAPRELVGTIPTTAPEDLEAELDQEAREVIPIRPEPVMPEASDPVEHPSAD